MPIEIGLDFNNQGSANKGGSGIPDSALDRHHGPPPRPTKNNPPPITASATPGPPVKTHIRHDGNDLDFDTNTYEKMSTQEICTFLNSTCRMLDSMLGGNHHEIPLSVIEFYKPQQIPTPEEAKKKAEKEGPPKDAIVPSYVIEETLFGSVATLETLYKMGTLLFNKPLPKLENKFNSDPSTLGHIFRKSEGHFTENTAENRNIILQVCNDKKNCLGFDPDGNLWFAKNFHETQTQIWARVREGTITNAGLNKNVLDYDPAFIDLKIKYGMKP